MNPTTLIQRRLDAPRLEGAQAAIHSIINSYPNNKHLGLSTKTLQYAWALALKRAPVAVANELERAVRLHCKY